MDNLYTQWVHQQPQLLSDQNDGDWSKDRSPTVPPSSGTESTLAAAASALDMSDFTLTDMAVPSGSSSSLSTTPQQFFSYPPHSYFTVQSPYNTMAYGSPTWPTQSHVPLSNYSSLNGATTSSTPSSSSPASSSQPQQHSPQLQQHQIQVQQPKPPSQPQSQLQQALMIDPSLTTLNGNSRTASNMQHYPQANYNAQPSTLQPQQQPQTLTPQQYSYSQLIQSYRTQPSYYPPPQQQQQQSPQGTLSPQALHDPSSSILSSLMPSSFYAQPSPSSSSQQQQHSQQSQQPPRTQQPPAPPRKTPQELKVEFQATLRPLLVSSAFTGAGAVSILADAITDYGAAEVDANIRLEILTKMRDGAGNHYFRAWSENMSAMGITRDWLKAGLSANAESPLVETIMPLLHIIDRLPMTLETLKNSKLGKIVVKLVKEPRSPAIKDMASNVERKWRLLINNGEAPPSKATDIEDLKSKSLKRKLSEPQVARGAPPPPKKSTLGNATASSSKFTVVKKELAASKPAAKDAKSDSSFFSAPKPKPKFPSFKKAPPAPPAPAPSKAGSSSNVAQPSSANPFEEALKSMGRTAKRESPAVATPPSTSDTPPQAQTNGLTKKGTKKKSVTWAPPGLLEKIKLIERAVYDDDPVDGNHTTHTVKDLDRGEGAALHAHLFEETVDWSEPMLIDNPVVIEEERSRGAGSEEKVIQEKREQTALGALYMSLAHIPDSPAEPPHVISEEETERDMATMTAGTDVDAVFWSSGPVSPVAQSVADLVGQLATGATDPALSGAQFNGQGLDLAAVGLDATSTLAAVQALPQEQIQRLLQQLQPLQQPLPNAIMFPAAGQHSYANNTPDQNPSAATKTRRLVGEDGGEEGAGVEAEAEEIMAIETIPDDYPAVFLRQEGERISL
ncbi:hypothetical protein DXG01_013852 [Tephrocybe rancida]|nr:hypothetical protein DXG01_013852 [Tephrocybe rancida]